jgi:hypothetical protein
MDGSVHAIVANLLRPPGRKPDRQVVELSEWYLALDENDREMVRRILAEVAHAAVFEVFAVLDGAARIDRDETPCEFELWYSGQHGRTKLNGDLHDELNSKDWHR